MQIEAKEKDVVFQYNVSLDSLLEHINYMEDDDTIETLSQEEMNRFVEVITDKISDAVTEFAQEIREARER